VDKGDKHSLLPNAMAEHGGLTQAKADLSPKRWHLDAKANLVVHWQNEL
jgi:hypothetical protein